MGTTLRVRNEAQRVLVQHELKGQISDGMWENTPGTGWEQWCNAEVVVDPENVGRNFYARKDNFNLNSSSLFEIVGERMVEMVRDGVPVWNAETKSYDHPNPGVDPTYTAKKCREDLKDLKVIFRTKLDTPDPEEVTAKRAKAAQERAEAQEKSRAKKARQAADIKVIVKNATGYDYQVQEYDGKVVLSFDQFEKVAALLQGGE